MRNLLNDLISVVLSGLTVTALLLGIVDYNMDSYQMKAIAYTAGINRNGVAVGTRVGFNPRGSLVPVLINHSRYTEDMLGHITEFYGTPEEVFIVATLHGGINQNILDRMIWGDLKYVSIGYYAMETINGVVTDADIFEVSVVTVPADAGARILSVERMNLWFYLKRFFNENMQ